ncbi:hypothetical protein WR25_11021 [Diploscapter pachys]|uniref:Dynactin subunit 1 n=1 Tax=Diploscapter pachys TaxID=2018661 RepID=A0A2A2K2V7_9BILA|nr:hypothetical protein WR25_11021 [Diploscapter pachys]
MSFEIGTRVETEKNGKGRVVFCGEAQFADGVWVGVILDEPKGKNNGTVKDVKYFECEPNYGLFIRPNQLKPESAAAGSAGIPKSKMPMPSGMKTPASAAAQMRKDSLANKKLSPGTSPKMSPAVSVEKLSKTPRTGSTSKLASAESRESSNLSQGSVAAARQAAGTAGRSQIQKTPSNSPPKKEEQEKEKPPQKLQEQQQQQQQQVPVADRVKAIRDTGVPPSPTIVPAGMDVGTENEYLKVQVKDLTEKLDTLKMKRREDQQKLSEFPLLKAELDSLQSVKQKLHDEHVDLTRQLQEEKKLNRELRDWIDSKKDEMSTNAEMMEMATIDKEMAEERSEALQGELDHYKSKCDELEAELELLKEEMASGGADGRIPEGNSVQVKQLEQQNHKLKEALIKMRDVNGQAVEDRSEAVKEADRLRAENLALINRTEAAIRAQEETEQSIRLYQEQVDAALGAEEMVTALTSQNMDLEDKIRKLEQDLEELEQLRDMDEQIIDTLKQGEKDLKTDIETLKKHIYDLNGRIREEQSHSKTLSDTILKFRTKTQQLNEEIQDYKDQILNLEDELRGQRQEENSALSMASQLQVSTGKMFAENVEKHVALVELDFAKKQIGYLKAFLPDNFTKHGGDNDSVNLIVMFPRMIIKSQILSKLASERFPHVAGGMRREHVTKSHKAEQWAHIAKLAFLTDGLAAVLGQFESATQTIPLERLATQQPEMAIHEKTLDNYFELLKQGRFDENTALDQLDKAVLYFQNKFSVDVGSGTFAAEKWVAALLKQLLDGLVWIKNNAHRIGHFMEDGSESSQLAGFLQQIKDEVAQCEQLAVKASKRVPNDGKKILKLNSEFTDELQSAIQQVDRVASILHETASIASVQIGMLTESDGFPSDRMKEMLHAVIEKIHGSTPLDRVFSPVEKHFGALRDDLSKIATALENGLMEEVKPEKKEYPALLERAHQRKQAAAEAEGLRWQLEKKDNEILELKKLLKSRIDDISNYKLRLDMAEAKMDSFGKQDNAKTQHWESKIEQMVNDQKKKQNEFDEALDRLQREINALTKENEELKERAKMQSKMKLLQVENYFEHFYFSNS